MNDKYKYKGQPLSKNAAMKILNQLEGAAGITAIITKLRSYHEEHGGLSTEDDNLEVSVRSALKSLSLLGRANELSKDYWRIPPNYQSIFGDGKHWVYLYYFEEHKVDAESQGKHEWQCKIGKADKDPEGRIRRQTSGTPVPPRIAFLLRTDQHVKLEGAIHRILDLRGRHLEKAQGDEWFLTSPDEVMEIYDFIIHKNPNFTKRRKRRHNRLTKRDISSGNAEGATK